MLAACGTATGPVSASEGAIGLARPFLASGVPAVVATLWPIDDAPSQELFVRFHREYLANGDPTTALRSAQLAMLANDDPALSRPGSWAGVQLFVEEPAGLP